MAGDQQPGGVTFDDVYADHFELVWRCLRTLGVPAGVLDDAAQDVFVIVHRQLPGFRGESSLPTWLFGIIRNVASNHRRGVGRKQAPLVPLTEEPVHAGPGPIEHAQDREAAAFIQGFMAALDDDSARCSCWRCWRRWPSRRSPPRWRFPSTPPTHGYAGCAPSSSKRWRSGRPQLERPARRTRSAGRGPPGVGADRGRSRSGAARDARGAGVGRRRDRERRQRNGRSAHGILGGAPGYRRRRGCRRGGRWLRRGFRAGRARAVPSRRLRLLRRRSLSRRRRPRR